MKNRFEAEALERISNCSVRNYGVFSYKKFVFFKTPWLDACITNIMTQFLKASSWGVVLKQYYLLSYTSTIKYNIIIG